MKSAWAMVFDRGDAAVLGGVRLVPGLMVAEVGDDLWLRGEGRKGESESVAALPARARYRPAGEQLFRGDGQLPVGTLPAMGWQALASWLTVDLGAGCAGGRQLPAAVIPRLQRGGDERPCAALRLPLAALAAWVGSTPRRRWQGLRVAVNGEGEALVVGEPVPPLAGQRYWLDAGVLVPLGWGIAPALPPASWRELLGVAGDDLVVFAEDGSWELVPGAALVLLTRRGVRLTTARAMP